MTSRTDDPTNAAYRAMDLTSAYNNCAKEYVDQEDPDVRAALVDAIRALEALALVQQKAKIRKSINRYERQIESDRAKLAVLEQMERGA